MWPDWIICVVPTALWRKSSDFGSLSYLYQRVVSLTWSNPVNDDELFPFEIVNLQRINSLMVQYYSSINFDQRVKLERKESLKLKGSWIRENLRLIDVDELFIRSQGIDTPTHDSMNTTTWRDEISTGDFFKLDLSLIIKVCRLISMLTKRTLFRQYQYGLCFI